MTNETFFSGSGLRFGQSYKHSFATNPWFFLEAKTSWQDFNGGLTVVDQSNTMGGGFQEILMTNLTSLFLCHTGWNHLTMWTPLGMLKQTCFFRLKKHENEKKNTPATPWGQKLRSRRDGVGQLNGGKYKKSDTGDTLGFATTSP